MADELSDPILGTLSRRDDTIWVGRVWFTPKHEIEVVFDQWLPNVDDVPEQLARASAAFVEMRSREWEHRLATARELDRESDGEWADAAGEEPDPAELARWLLLVGVELYGDGSAWLVYHGPPPWDDNDLCAGVSSEGSHDGVEIYGRGAWPW